MEPKPPTLPPNLMLEYLAEGAANVVFRIRQAPQSSPERGAGDDSFGPDTPPPTELEEWQTDLPGTQWPFAGQDVLLRLRKDVPGATAVLDAHGAYEDVFVPLLGRDNLVEQWLVELASDTVDTLNLQLQHLEAEGRRPARRKGVPLRQERFGLIVLDMSANQGRHRCMVEIKPKWLVQSPTAPADAVRCRTCALRAHRLALDAASHSKDAICPLTLLSDEDSHLHAVVTALLMSSRVSADPTTLDRLRQFLRRNKLIPLLRDLQIKYNTSDVLKADTADMALRTAMTIRDCAMFVRVRAVCSGRIAVDWYRCQPIPVKELKPGWGTST